MKPGLRVGKPYVWNAWALETPPHALAWWASVYLVNPFREALERPERVSRWEDDGGTAGPPQRGLYDAVQP